MYSKCKPYVINAVAGEPISICQCGATKTPPYCDCTTEGGSCECCNAGVNNNPLEYIAKTDEQVYICGCGKSSNMPFCDGSHNK
ncbi:MAG TPA: CDGSH iron-sulfur domain-containing protein [Piscirickettsiaceae bacterium]|jgi:CDGSH-type Zn-finger protein|nr:CDGSH iron-sulfur domain-containing protein [Piscirickettsiaceae bacterium]